MSPLEIDEARDLDQGWDENPMDRIKSSRPGPDRSVHIFVSLYLILIAFFMVLNAISNQETARAEAVMDSVNTTFKKIHLPKVNVVDLLAEQQLDAHSDAFYEEVEGLLAGLVDFPGRFPSPGGNEFRVEMPVSVLFDGRDVQVRAEQTLFMNALGDLLKREGLNEHREVRILIGAPAAIMDSEAPWQSLFVKRAANFAADLEDRGVSGQSISTGIVVTDNPTVRLVFSSRQGEVIERDRRGSD